jgi:flagellar hook-basal body complex protein FliE
MAGITPAQLSAIAAYEQASKPILDGPPRPDFGAALQRALDGVVATSRAADVAATNALMGQGSVTDVVLAVSRAELALQTTVAIRDRVVAAYQEIMRMPI